MEKDYSYRIITLVLILVFIMILVDAVFSINYGYRAILKMFLFLILPFILKDKVFSTSIKSIFKVNFKSVKNEILLGITVYIFILISFYILRNFVDFSSITKSMSEKVGVNKKNFIYVSIYISFINSFIEEVFFRGITYIKLSEVTNDKFALYFSSLIFSLYHIFIMNNWFSKYIFLLLLFSLFIAGLIFGKLNKKNKNIYSSWIVHMFANFSINTIGFILFKSMA